MHPIYWKGETYEWSCIDRLHGRHTSSKVTCRASKEAALRLANCRARHSGSLDRKFQDQYAAALVNALGQAEDSTDIRKDCNHQDTTATAYIDEQLLTALGLVNMDLREEYRQVVLLGCGLDTRPYRLLWPEGTVIYEIAPAELHTVGYRIMKEQKASVPRGVLFRRVPWEFQAGTSFADALRRAGHQGSRLSVWGIQGLWGFNLSDSNLRDLMTDVSLASAFGSIVLGELPHMSRQQAEDLLAEHALLGTMQCLTHGSYPTHSEDQTLDRWLFTTQHKQLSAEEMDTYDLHTRAAAEADEDFFDNFS